MVRASGMAPGPPRHVPADTVHAAPGVPVLGEVDPCVSLHQLFNWNYRGLGIQDTPKAKRILALAHNPGGQGEEMALTPQKAGHLLPLLGQGSGGFLLEGTSQLRPKD